MTTLAIYVCRCRISLELNDIRVIATSERSCVLVLEDSLGSMVKEDLLVKHTYFTWIAVLLRLEMDSEVREGFVQRG